MSESPQPVRDGSAWRAAQAAMAKRNDAARARGAKLRQAQDARAELARREVARHEMADLPEVPRRDG